MQWLTHDLVTLIGQVPPTKSEEHIICGLEMMLWGIFRRIIAFCLCTLWSPWSFTIISAIVVLTTM